MRFITFLNYPLIDWKQADLNSQRLSTLYYKRADSSSASAILFLQHPQSAKTYQENIAAAFAWNVLVAISEYHVWVAACKMSKYGVFFWSAFSCIFLYFFAQWIKKFLSSQFKSVAYGFDEFWWSFDGTGCTIDVKQS